MKNSLKASGLALAMLLCACSSGEGGNEPAAQASEDKSATLLWSYEAARTSENWQAAESIADRILDKFPETPSAKTLQSSLADVRAKAEAGRETHRLAGLWDYQAVPVGKGTQWSASLYSRTPRVEEGEVANMPDAQLILRDHPEWGRSVYLLLAESKFKCGSPCAMRIVFDQAPAHKFRGKQADSGKGPALFVEEEPRFIKALVGAREVRIDLPEGSGRIKSLVFETGGYVAAKYETR